MDEKDLFDEITWDDVAWLQRYIDSRTRRGRHRGPYDIDECSECCTCNIIKATGRHAAAWTETWSHE